MKISNIYASTDHNVAIEKTLNNHDIEYVDLLLINQPGFDDKGLYQAMENNYQNTGLQEYVKQYGIIIESWYSFGGRGHTYESFDNEVIKELAEKYNKTSAQIILRWHTQMGFVVIPGTKNEEHILQNADIFDFTLSDEEMSKIAKINKNVRYYNRTDSQLEQLKNWHPDFEKQNLIVVDGEGWYQEEGGEPRSLKKGDIVTIPSNVKHWHGAKANTWFSHLAIEVPGEETSNEWCEPVTDEEY